MEAVEDLENLRNTVISIEESIGKRVIGSRRIVRFMFIALLTGNHILMEGVPGLAKTMLANEFARHTRMKFRRIQFTPDMLPSDVTGTIMFNIESRKMEFKEGPIFANVILADEINRTPPKVQSALLEAMEETQVTIGGETHSLPKPFFVIATQNPIEQEGTFPLAEALMDRFLFRYYLEYPSREDELNILNSIGKYDDPSLVLMPDEIIEFRSQVDNVYISEEIKQYLVDLMRRTRENDLVYLGASPRTTAKYMKAARANALISGRSYVIPEDITFMAFEILNHRLILKPEAIMDETDDPKLIVKRIIDRVLSEVPVPK
ncbi:regulatory protein moxR related protein [Thermoplasma acidophilum]|uniref:Regulatory protein moxR related protein n=1 Tax=Thermoplasma acidophilum (strain ATCC 25905 / DSM 1728 / JCM 9062 / NBRC 15155 / AMRC-C165) TaxID=273075 RepID=Q9HJP7_THEAC|nr:MoxR family ATPase [Thermoplasma acidophilum]MCY0852277.1 MoxR family ATPase [Thermoplasma acidophilum]CAC12049.1 regulatory protein moxR related protein [Thermoplasma acidophilum]